MSNESYAREIVVNVNAGAAYRALTEEIDKWWAPVSNAVTAVGDTVTVRFDPTFWTMRVNKLASGERVEWECIEANHIVDGMPGSIREEWVGTKLIWNIRDQEEKTKISFIHEGLVPSLECFDICEASWDYFFVNSLKSYLDTGEGTPG
jgi:hypothetical protein